MGNLTIGNNTLGNMTGCNVTGANTTGSISSLGDDGGNLIDNPEDTDITIETSP